MDATLAELRCKAEQIRDRRIAEAHAEFQRATEAITQVEILLSEPEDEDRSLLGYSSRNGNAERETGLATMLRESIFAFPIGETFTVRDAVKSAHAKHPDASFNQNSVSTAIRRIAEESDRIDVVQQGRGRRPTLYRLLPDNHPNSMKGSEHE